MQLSDELKGLLETLPFAAVCLPLDLGRGPEAVLVVKATADLLGGLKAAEAPVAVGWVVEATARGPAVCLVLRAEAPGVGELAGELYFDPSDPGDDEALGLLAAQERLKVTLLDEDLHVAWVADVPWGELRRLEAEQVRDRAAELLERCPEYDLEAARALFQDAVPLDRLLARAFPEPS